MKALSFLGPSNYQFTKYRYRGQEVPTRFFAETLPRFFPATEKVLIFATPTVRKHSNLEELRSRLGDLLAVVPIPESHTEKALWEIFDALTEHVAEGERVVFDITSSFRSLPFLTFIAAAFLRSARSVEVAAVLYGAFEARDEHNVSPVFDLTSFVTLFDWLAATNQFLYTGNARELAAQLEKSDQPALHPLAQNVRNIAQGLALLRPRDVSDAALQLPDNLKAVRAHFPKPFEVVVQPLETAYTRFAVRSSDPREHLYRQLEMINWYLDKERYVHALALAREWAVSLVCLHFGDDLWDKDDRADAEILLSGGKRGNRESRHRHEWHSVPCGWRLRQLWKEPPCNLSKLRNDVLHTGFRKNPETAEEIIERAREAIRELNAIAEAWEEGTCDAP